MTTTRLDIATGDLGTEQTVAEMSRLICTGALTPDVRNVAVDIVMRAGDDPLERLYALRDWLASNFQFVPDPSSGELLHDAPNLLAQVNERGVARGDCDDAAILGGALACAVGFRVGLVVVGFDPDGPFQHVWASASPPQECVDRSGRQVWIELDTTRPMQRIPMQRLARRRAFPVC